MNTYAEHILNLIIDGGEWLLFPFSVIFRPGVTYLSVNSYIFFGYKDYVIVPRKHSLNFQPSYKSKDFQTRQKCVWV